MSRVDMFYTESCSADSANKCFGTALCTSSHPKRVNFSAALSPRPQKTLVRIVNNQDLEITFKTARRLCCISFPRAVPVATTTLSLRGSPDKSRTSTVRISVVFRLSSLSRWSTATRPFQSTTRSSKNDCRHN